jgi:hypothetical protein
MPDHHHLATLRYKRMLGAQWPSAIRSRVAWPESLKASTTATDEPDTASPHARFPPSRKASGITTWAYFSVSFRVLVVHPSLYFSLAQSRINCE